MYRLIEKLDDECRDDNDATRATIKNVLHQASNKTSNERREIFRTRNNGSTSITQCLIKNQDATKDENSNSNFKKLLDDKIKKVNMASEYRKKDADNHNEAMEKNFK